MPHFWSGMVDYMAVPAVMRSDHCAANGITTAVTERSPVVLAFGFYSVICTGERLKFARTTSKLRPPLLRSSATKRARRQWEGSRQLDERNITTLGQARDVRVRAQANSRPPPANQPHRSESTLSRANTLLSRGDFNRARRILRELVRRSSADTRAWLALGKLECRAGALDTARQVFRTACEHNPDCVHLFHSWAGLEERSGDPDRAKCLYEKCLEINLSDGLAWQSLALLEEKLGNTEEARRRFERGSRAAPSNAHLWSAWGVLEQRHENYDKACRLFEKAVSIEPRHVRSIQSWAIAEEKRGHPEDAESLFKRALTIDPLSAPTYQAYALMEARRNNIQRARQLFSKGIDIDRNHAAILHAWATMEAKAENFDEARRIFDLGVRAAPNSTPMLRAWAAMELELGHIDESNDWTVPRNARSKNPYSRRSGPHGSRNTAYSHQQKQLSLVGENLQMLRRLIERRSDEDLRTVMKWIERRANEERNLKEKFTARGQSDARKVLEWAEKRGEVDVAAFKEFIDERYKRDRLIGVYMLNLSIPSLAQKRQARQVASDGLSVATVSAAASSDPKPQEWFVLDEPPRMTLHKFDQELYQQEANAISERRREILEGIEFLSNIGDHLAKRSALVLLLCSLTLVLTGTFAYLELNGYSPADVESSAENIAQPSGVDAYLLEFDPTV